MEGNAVPEIIRLSQIIHAYDHADSPEQAVILRGVDLTVPAGEFVGIHGRSGSGKSTLLYIAGGLLPPRGGQVFIGERSLFRLGDRELSHFRNRMIGFVFQNYHLAPALTAVENVMVPALLAGESIARARRHAVERLDQVGLADKALARPAELSGGQMQRVAVARALINAPAILLADEPTGNLDEHTGAEILALISRHHREDGLTVLMATHDEAVEMHATRRLELADGRLFDRDDAPAAPPAESRP